jgi:hypothetical protein
MPTLRQIRSPSPSAASGIQGTAWRIPIQDGSQDAVVQNDERVVVRVVPASNSRPRPSTRSFRCMRSTTCRSANSTRFCTGSPAGFAPAACSSPTWARVGTPGSFEADWLGAPTYFSGYDVDANRALPQAAGLHIVTGRQATHWETIDNQMRPVRFFWALSVQTSTDEFPR